MDASKWIYSLMAAVLFVLIASPFMFHVTQTLIAGPLGYTFITVNGMPTTLGLLVHGVVFGLIVRLMMGA